MTELVINLNICGDSPIGSTREAVVKALESVDLRAAVKASLLSSDDLLPQQPYRRMSMAPPPQAQQAYHQQQHHPLQMTMTSQEAPIPNTYWQAPLPKAKSHRPRSRSSNDLSGLVIEVQKQDHDDTDNSTIATSATSAFRRSRSSNDLRSLASLTMSKVPSRRDLDKSSGNATFRRRNQQERADEEGNDSDSKVYVSAQGKRRRERNGTGRRSRSASGIRSLASAPTREELRMPPAAAPSFTTRTSRSAPDVPPPLITPTRTAPKRRGSTGSKAIQPITVDSQSFVSDITGFASSTAAAQPSCRWNSNSKMLPPTPQTMSDESDLDATNSGADSDSRVYRTAQGKRRKERTMNRDASGNRVRSRSATRLRSVNSFPVAQQEAKPDWVPEVVQRAQAANNAAAPSNGRMSRSQRQQQQPRYDSDAGSVSSIGTSSLVMPNMPKRMGSLTTEDAERVHERRERRQRRSRSRQRALSRNNSAKEQLATLQEHTVPRKLKRSLSTGASVVSELTMPPTLPRRMNSRDDKTDGGLLNKQRSKKRPMRRNRSANDLMSACSAPADLQMKMMSRKRESLDSSYTDLFGGFKDRPSCKPSRRGSNDQNSSSRRTETTRSYYGDLFEPEDDASVAEEEEVEEISDHQQINDDSDDDDDDSDSEDEDSDSEDEDSDDDDDDESSAAPEELEEPIPAVAYTAAAVPNKRSSAGSVTSTLTSMAPWTCACGEENEGDANFCGMCARSKKWTCTECYYANNKCRAIFCGGCAKQRSALA